jgi:hypothetical protein
LLEEQHHLSLFSHFFSFFLLKAQNKGLPSRQAVAKMARWRTQAEHVSGSARRCGAASMGFKRMRLLSSQNKNLLSEKTQ